ncbi:MAG: TIGR00282 family metallophosphoesterase [Ruminococcaceae bacterium]|nr:TIGR00282 family metallophosphoesterase [Oscillospiraceae bacterium]
MNILVLGDVVNSEGCSFLKKKLPAFKKLKAIDFCIANGENSADGNGITPDSAKQLFASGVDFITTGNHVYRRKEVFSLLDESEFIIRPCNYSDSNPGVGSKIVDCGFFSVGIINVMGTMFMESLRNPFDAVDDELNRLKGNTNIILVDLHAEATSEKKAMGFYLDGRVSAVFGTHTHVLTADNTVLPGGTGYITDIGMCGVKNSVLGVDKDIIIEKFRFNMPQRFDKAQGSAMINGCIFTIDKATGKCTGTELVSFE